MSALWGDGYTYTVEHNIIDRTLLMPESPANSARHDVYHRTGHTVITDK